MKNAMGPGRVELATLAAAHLARSFFGAGTVKPLLDDARQMPDAVDWIAYERRLCTDATGIDLSVSVSRESARPFVTALGPNTAAPILHTLQRWVSSAAGPALHRMPHVWLEFDHDAGAHRPLWERGFCFLGFDAGPHPRGAASLLPEMVAALGGEPASALAAVAVENALPDSMRLLNLAYLPHRGAPEVRLHLRLPPQALVDAMRALNWGGDIRALEETLGIFDAVGSQRVAIQLAVHRELAPTLGIELFLHHADAAERWPKVLERMRRLALASDDDAAELGRWYGHSTLSAKCFPDLPIASCVDMTRDLHVKFMLDQRGFAGAKGYLFCNVRQVPF